jgi:hypothetical protein
MYGVAGSGNQGVESLPHLLFDATIVHPYFTLQYTIWEGEPGHLWGFALVGGEFETSSFDVVPKDVGVLPGSRRNSVKI